MNTLNHLSTLISERDELAARLSTLDNQITSASRAYWRTKGYFGTPRIETIRQEIASGGVVEITPLEQVIKEMSKID